MKTGPLSTLVLLLTGAAGAWALPPASTVSARLAAYPISRSDRHRIAPVEQVLSWNFDWDDNILYMETKIYLIDENGVERPVSTAEYALIRDQVGDPGSPEWGRYHTDSDPIKGSFRRFRDSPDTNHFLEDLISTITTESPGEWQAPSWEAFVEALSTPESAARIRIITARGHSSEKMLEALKWLQKLGYIRYLPPLENIHAVGNTQSPSIAKTEVMMKSLDEIQAKGPPTTGRWVTSPDMSGVRPMHLWGFSDDDYGNIEAARKVLSEGVRAKRWPSIKITLFFTGTNRPDLPPQAWVFQPDGSLRPMRPSEAQEFPHRHQRKKAVHPLRECGLAF